MQLRARCSVDGVGDAVVEAGKPEPEVLDEVSVAFTSGRTTIIHNCEIEYYCFSCS